MSSMGLFGSSAEQLFVAEDKEHHQGAPLSRTNGEATKTEAAILSELSECVYMLSRLQLVLSDILELTEPKANDGTTRNSSGGDHTSQACGGVSLSHRMDRLLEELQEWEQGATGGD